MHADNNAYGMDFAAAERQSHNESAVKSIDFNNSMHLSLAFMHPDAKTTNQKSKPQIRSIVDSFFATGGNAVDADNHGDQSPYNISFNV